MRGFLKSIQDFVGIPCRNSSPFVDKGHEATKVYFCVPQYCTSKYSTCTAIQ